MNSEYNKKQNSYSLENKNSLGGFAFYCLMVVYVLLTFVGQAILSSFLTADSVLFIAISSFFSIASIIFVFFVLNKRINGKLLENLSIKKCKFNYFVLAIFLSVAMFLGLGFVNDLFANILKGWGLKVGSFNMPLTNAGEYILFSICFAVLPSIAEEMFFRGFLLGLLDKSKPIVSSVVCSICFAFYHCSLNQLIYQFIYGFFLCILAIKSKSIIPCIVAHFLNNFAIITFTFFNLKIDLYSVVLIVIGVIILMFEVFCLFFVKNNKDKAENQSGKEKNKNYKMFKSFLIPFGLIAILLCVAIIITNSI